MNKLVAVITAGLLAGSVAFAADKDENKNEETTKTSKNIITGTKTTKHEIKKHAKNAKGEKVDATITETTKEQKDGTVKKSVDVDAKSTEKH